MRTVFGLALLLGGCTALPPPSSAPSEAVFDEAAYAAEFYYPPPEPTPEALADERAGQVADARYFTSFADYDKAYIPDRRHQAKAMAAKLVDDAADLNHEQFVLRLAEIVALADNGHTALGENAWRKNTARVPLRTYPFADGLHVVWAGTGFEHLLGARIDRIEGRPTREVQKALRRYAGGPDRWRDAYLLAMLESPAILNAAGLAAGRSSLEYSGVFADGTLFTEQIEAEERGKAAWISTTARTLFPREPGWRMSSFLKSDADLPLYLRNSGQLLNIEPAPKGGLYFAMGAVSDPDGETLEDYLVGVLDRVETGQPAYFVLDLRMNGGGDLTKAHAFARALPAAMGGRPIYVFTSPFTFSAAITTAAAVKDAGGEQVTIVGEQVGDRLAFWSEGGAFHLPNAFVDAYYTSGRHDYREGCQGTPGCYWLMDRYPVRVDDLNADIDAPLTFAAYRDLRDPAMDAILADLELR